VWSKLECPDAAERWRLSDLKAWLQEAHGLKLTAWNLPCGETTDPETGEKKPVATRVYPVPEVVDLRKLPSLELSKPKAMMALTQAGIRGAPMMKRLPARKRPSSSPCEPSRRYLNEWSKYKQLGGLPADLPEPGPDLAAMPLRDILEARGNMALGHRSRVLLDGLSCSVARPAAASDAMGDEDFEDCDVEKLAPVLLKINL